ncbi:NAD(P)-binding protein [Pluteus cervinus]|uniref:NAD(P)-binding protein n=1 Tax=Pluteus cervinus TaxID=181527 RepID=A0ACD3A9E0_9AGAR|nr:NAD(P)-binding protein [Pluteus cervinus]
MTILITGGTGKTGTPLSQKLYDAGHSVLVASRSGSAPAPLKGVKLDWFDPSTFENPFNADSDVDKVYLIGPHGTNMLAPLKPFIDLAVSKGVKRFVLLSASLTGPGGPGPGKIHEYLAGLGVDYGVLRPSGFFENFATSFMPSIRHRDELVTATQDGKIPFVAVDDIVGAAFHALTTSKIENPNLFVLGPDLLNYDQVAEIFSEALGRKISHRRITVPEAVQVWKGYGVPDDVANMLAGMDALIAQGKEERLVEEKDKYVAKVHLADWVAQRKAVWAKV